MAGRKRPKPGCRVTKRLREPPYRLYRSDLNAYVVLVDRFATRDTEKALIILRDGESETRAFRIADILSPAEMEEQESRRGAPDWWFRGVLIDFGMDGRSITLTTPHQRRVDINLEIR